MTILRFTIASAESWLSVLAAERLYRTDSSYESSKYVYECGCVVCRNVGEEEHCQVRWCLKHGTLEAPQLAGSVGSALLHPLLHTEKVDAENAR